ncbi:MAG: hypothetical protein WCH37_11725, partial [Synechococcaceae cyanobacterium ELA182]
MAELPFGPTGVATMVPPVVDAAFDAVAHDVEGIVAAQAPDGSGGPGTLESIVRVAHQQDYSDV